MARQRQKARERKRRAQEGDGGGSLRSDNGQPVNVSGEVDEFEAAVISGGETDGTDVETVASMSGLRDDSPETAGALAASAGSRRPTTRVPGGGPRAVQFLKASWAELQRVQWPDRRAVAQATAVVVGFVIVAGAYLGAADYVAKEVVDWII